TVSNGLSLNSTLNLGNDAGNTNSTLTFSGTQMLTGTGTVVFGGSINSNSIKVSSGASLTIGPGITLRGKQGTINGTFINQGTISADTSGGNISLTGGVNWSNTGTMQAVNSGTLNLGGSFQTTGLGSITSASSSTINITGTLNNANSTLELNAMTGSW